MSCLFLSLAPATGKQPGRIRQEIVDYLKTDPPLLDNMKASDITAISDGQSLEAYTNAMSQPFVWGGALEIRAFVELYSIDVTVHVLYTGKQFTIERSNGASNRNMHISYNGSHFEPIALVADGNRIIWRRSND